MSKLIFNSDEVRKLIAHSKGKEHPDKMYGFPVEDKEYLYLVHDDGVYLMSGAKESFLSPEAVAHNALVDFVGYGRKSTSQVVSYALGCNPKKDEDFREQSRYLVGGDDFGDPIGLDFFETAIKLYDAAGLTQFVLEFSPNKIAILDPRPKAKKGRGR